MIFDNEIILENDVVRLEPLSMTHLDKLVPIAVRHPNLLQYSPSTFGTRESLSNYIHDALNAKKQNLRIALAIYDKRLSDFVGSTSFGNISPYNKRLEIGWTWLDKSAQGTGLNKACKYLLLEFAFETLKYERVELKTDARNMQSRKAIEKIGGVYEGTLRSHTLMLDGYRRDTVYYGILREEWERVKEILYHK